MTSAKMIQTHLEESGVEIYQKHEDEFEIAERVRFHMMDSGIRVHVSEPPTVRFSAKCQRSDHPGASEESLLARVRDTINAVAAPRGYVELRTRRVEVRDPMDDKKILDIWTEIVFAKETELAVLAAEVKWALALEKCVP